jgi:hypothetical protein
MTQNTNDQSSSQQQDESTHREITNNTAGSPQSEAQRETAEMRERIRRRLITLDEVINTLQNMIDRLSNLLKNSSEQSKSLYQK